MNAETSIIKANGRGLALTSMSDYMEFARCVVDSGLAPHTLDTPQKVIVAVQCGAELGLSPMQSLQSIAVINGKPSLYGDTALALVRSSGLLEWIKEEITGSFSTDLSKVPGDVSASCTVKRVGDPEPNVRTFCVAEARLAGLWQKRGRNGQPTPWCSHPKRMLMYRARAFALRDTFPDCLVAMHIYEELQGEAPLHVESTCTSQTLLDDKDEDDVSREGQYVQSVQEHAEETGQDGPGLHGQGPDPRPAGMDKLLDQKGE